MFSTRTDSIFNAWMVDEFVIGFFVTGRTTDELPTGLVPVVEPIDGVVMTGVGVELAPQAASVETPAISDVEITKARKRLVIFGWAVVFIVFLLEELLVGV